MCQLFLRNKIRLFRLILLIVIVAGSYGCSRSIESGEFRGLVIGATAKDVFDVIADQQEVSHILSGRQPLISVDAGSIEKLEELFDSEGVILRMKGTEIRVQFDNNGVASQVWFSDDRKIVPIITLGMRRDEVQVIFANALRENDKLRAYTFDPESYWIDISNATAEEREGLFADAMWMYHENNMRSTTRLYFENEKLQRVEYKWSLIELP